LPVWRTERRIGRKIEFQSHGSVHSGRGNTGGSGRPLSRRCVPRWHVAVCWQSQGPSARQVLDILRLNMATSTTPQWWSGMCGLERLLLPTCSPVTHKKLRTHTCSMSRVSERAEGWCAAARAIRYLRSHAAASSGPTNPALQPSVSSLFYGTPSVLGARAREGRGHSRLKAGRAQCPRPTHVQL